MVDAPRWRLTAAHYLNVSVLPDGTKVEWEHKETKRETGRTMRRLFPVPMFLEPKDAADHNYPGEIIVAHEVAGCHNLANDYVFTGPPTQEMEPLNDEAEAISDAERLRWIHPIDTMPANGGMNAAESAFMAKMMQVFEKIAPPHATAPTVVPDGEVADLKERLARLEALLASQAKSTPSGERRA